ncbi:MAG: 16S rRNA (guanine(527)-N(7))-methyltransferase RsmG, partial [Armatimonadetes bacterium]|nr:16S rRNA (guanine(527)-N(7))-methyltransferase RsmG [Armatimonadota bacterium]
MHTPCATDIDELRSGAAEMGVDLSGEQSVSLVQYLDLMYGWNERLNLTRVPRAEAVPRHLMGALSVLCALDDRPTGRCLDLGSGGGLPGIPFSVALPDWSCVLMDARRKKVGFLLIAIAELGLVNAVAVHARAEEAAGMSAHRGA